MSHPVFGKTESLFKRDEHDHTKVNPAMNPAFQAVIDQGLPWVASVKKDGSCGAIFAVNGQWGLYRRQDITKKSRSYAHVRETGTSGIIAGHPCWITTMVRGTGKHEKMVDVYFFDITQAKPEHIRGGQHPQQDQDANGLPQIDAGHMIGFTAIDPLEDKYVMSAVEPNPEDPSNPYVFSSRFEGSCDIPVVKTTMKSLAAIHGSELITVELMCRKFADHNGLTDDRCFVSPHGEEVIPAEHMPNPNGALTYDGILEWFKGDATNRWANQEGIVFLVPSTGARFKLHRGHMNMEDTWRAKKESGLRFMYV
jgi:hypothetical protein